MGNEKKEVSQKIEQKGKKQENNRSWGRQLEDPFRKSNIQILRTSTNRELRKQRRWKYQIVVYSHSITQLQINNENI